MILGLGFVFVFSFLLGSIPWGVIISRLFFHTDIREHGSGNIGTTNALRTLGKIGGGAVFVLDFAKGLLAGYVAWRIGATMDAFAGGSVPLAFESSAIIVGPLTLWPPTMQDIALSLAFASCVCGHVFSPWLHFKGGKGIAVAIGCVFFTFGWPSALLELAVFAICVVATRYVSLGSIASAVVSLFLSVFIFWGNSVAIALSCIVGLVVIWAHRGNIVRLRAGTENRVGAKSLPDKQTSESHHG